jgi:hypothetical protein
VNLKIFTNGIEDRNKSVRLRPDYAKFYQFSVDETKGKKQTVVVEVDGKKYQVFEVDFEADEVNRVKKTESYQLNEPEAEPKLDKNQDD